jgi:hypothetical protein
MMIKKLMLLSTKFYAKFDNWPKFSTNKACISTNFFLAICPATRSVAARRYY